MNMVSLRQFGVISTLVALLWLSAVEAYKEISDQTLLNLPLPGTDFDIVNGSILAPILRTRVPGTEGSATVRNHFINFFERSLPEWKVELQHSTAKTALPKDTETNFTNFIAVRDPPGMKPGDVSRVTLVAHYDSKLIPTGFIGATDSAAPCAIIMHVVRSINAALTRKWAAGIATPSPYQGIQVIFTDGEEDLTENDANMGDSLYGSRALASEWNIQEYPEGSRHPTRLASISLFMLLDLIGTSDPHISSYFKETHWLYENLARLHKRIVDAACDPATERVADWFADAEKDEVELGSIIVEDDHSPFVERGVGDILHIIDFAPKGRGFPEVWHTLDDDGQHLDLAAVTHWSVLVTGFIAEVLELEGFMDDHVSEN